MIATKLAVLMILPPWDRPFSGSGLFSLMARMAYLHPHQTPLTLICIVRSQIFSSVFKALSSAGCIIPALLNYRSAKKHTLSRIRPCIVISAMRVRGEGRTMISSRPNSLTARSTASLISFSTPTSVLDTTALMFGYLVAINTATASIPLGFISTKRTFAPSEANNKEVSNPMPLFVEARGG